AVKPAYPPSPAGGWRGGAGRDGPHRAATGWPRPLTFCPARRHIRPMAEIVHPLVPSVFRGLKGRCPACGEGRLFWRYLKVSGRCPKCDHDLARYPADDGPAYVTVL